jgi:hypothetical protein
MCMDWRWRFKISLVPLDSIPIWCLFLTERFLMRKILLGATVLCVVAALTSVGASAAPSAAILHVGPSHALVTDVDYYWHHNHYNHRHWAHGHYHYY